MPAKVVKRDAADNLRGYQMSDTFHLDDAASFKAALDKLCYEERRLRSNAAAPNRKLESDFRTAALAFVTAYRAKLDGATKPLTAHVTVTKPKEKTITVHPRIIE
jgi:hypothetical protein